MLDPATLTPDIIERYEPVIGLEVHAQLLTHSRAFARAGTLYGAAPNTATDPVVLGHPGTLPTVNRRLVEYAMMMGLATNCTIRRRCRFSRKNYFYPDLPKGYQISQFEDPLCYEGWVELEIDGEVRRIGITRIHMEEDAGKSIHDLDMSNTLVDLNRAGTPLIEIVSEPDIRSAREAHQYLRAIYGIVTYLGICSGNMEEGALRCDANVSVRPRGEERFGTKTEVKNMNSFRGVERAIEYEILRQIALIESGGRVVQETRLWDAGLRQTRTMRSKEEAHDYRYFPEPDLPPLEISEREIEEIRAALPELPAARRARFVAEYGLPPYDAGVLADDRSVGDYYEAVCAGLAERTAERFKLASNLVMTEVLRVLTEAGIEIGGFQIEPRRLAGLVDLFGSGAISSRNVKDIFAAMLESPADAGEISRERGYVQISDTGFIEEAIAGVLADNAGQLEAYRSGRTNLFGFFVGETMKRTRGKANPKLVNELLRARLEVG